MSILSFLLLRSPTEYQSLQTIGRPSIEEDRELTGLRFDLRLWQWIGKSERMMEGPISIMSLSSVLRLISSNWLLRESIVRHCKRKASKVAESLTE
jgi:hypothetical protein